MADRRRHVAALICALAVATTAGCGSDGTSTPGSAPAPRDLTEAERGTLARAEKILTRDCMRAAGFEFRVTDEPPESVDTRFPYVIDDPAWATSNGYGRAIRTRRDAIADDDPNQRYFRALAEPRRSAALRAFYGDGNQRLEARVPGSGTIRHSDKGCEANAQRGLYGDLPSWYRARKVTEALPRLVRSAVVRDARYTQVVQGWAACMRDRGLVYDTPLRAREQFLRADRADEVTTARAEAECALSTELGTTARDIDRAYRTDIDSRYSTDVRDRKVLENKALTRAQGIVARG
ncbi:hypothetical protein [Embleya sp. NPDC020630]|uniref:hypothetical protein n=1 Tax=Embleya sp. NPDC020630 TaxID=3363979 RepID=UPI00378781E0